ncbi:MAG: glycosyltransferase family 25 protein [Planctomycetaceae bacterium]|jgi:glycosyl transferase family 25|nr:glycosyltransferase family 25 protein [Planctomycetaceae bacterium]
MLHCYVINLDRATERWERLIKSPGLRELKIIRVPAIDGKTLIPPYPNFSPWGYYLCHGRKPNPNHIACHNSHLKAFQTFLDSGEEYGIICEDDIIGTPELIAVLKNVMCYADSWDLVRLTGFRQKPFIPFADLGRGYRLVSDLRCSTSAACYLINRKAAKILSRVFVPLRIHNDLAIFYGIPNGIREATVTPFPVILGELSKTSQIALTGNAFRYPIWHPYRLNFLTVLPYRFITRNWRTLHRIRVGIQRYFFPPKPLTTSDIVR